MHNRTEMEDGMCAKIRYKGNWQQQLEFLYLFSYSRTQPCYPKDGRPWVSRSWPVWLSWYSSPTLYYLHQPGEQLLSNAISRCKVSCRNKSIIHHRHLLSKPPLLFSRATVICMASGHLFGKLKTDSTTDLTIHTYSWTNKNLHKNSKSWHQPWQKHPRITVKSSHPCGDIRHISTRRMPASAARIWEDAVSFMVQANRTVTCAGEE